MTGDKISAQLVSVSFGRGPGHVQALDQVSVAVDAGEVVALAGPSGSGKSTLFEALLGWIVPDAGKIEVATEDRPGALGVVTQDLALAEELSVMENVMLGTDRRADADIAALLAQLELDELVDRAVAQLSLGQQQRVAVARALAAGPTVIIADEPTSHQDADRAELVMQLFRAAADRGSAVLLSSHDPRLIESCDRIIAIEHGRLRDGALPEPAPPSEGSSLSEEAPPPAVAPVAASRSVLWRTPGIATFMVAVLIAVVGAVALALAI